MAFNAELATALLLDDDRDVARFFAGREAERKVFTDAVTLAGRRSQALFRIFQGAPGCGKTSLAAHLRETEAANALFVDLGVEDLVDREALARRVRHVAGRAAPMWTRVAAAGLEALGSRLSVAPAAEAASGVLAERAVGKATIVLHVDEAQMIDETAQNVLVGLHTRGMGVPAVCLFTGLSHTETRIRGLDGLSRLASNATVNMGPLADAECAESTRMMLDALGTDGTPEEKDRAARLAAKLSFGWPQHLFCAQQALCRELANARGALAGVDVPKVRLEAQDHRHRYYRGRLDGTALGDWPVLVAGIAAKAMQERPATQPELARLCISEVERLKLHEDPLFRTSAEEFAELMVHKGVLCLSADHHYTVAIPSMARWLDRTFGQTAGAGRGRH